MKKALIILTLITTNSLQGQEVITDFPYFMGFEGQESFDTWSNMTEVDWQLGGGSASFEGQPGMYCLYLPGNVHHDNGEPRTAIMESPIFLISPLGMKTELSFQHRSVKNNDSYDWGTFTAQFKVNANDWITIYTSTVWEGDNNWKTVNINLYDHLNNNDIDTDTLRVRFIKTHRGHSNSTLNRHVYVDNVTITHSPIDRIDNDLINLLDEFPGSFETSPSYSSSSYYAASNLFDNNIGSNWRTADEVSWIEYTFTTDYGFHLNNYSLHLAYYTDSPTEWKLWGRLGQTNWVLIDSQYRSFSSSEDYQWHSFEVNSTERFNEFKFEVINTYNNDDMLLREIDFFGRIGYDNPNVLTLQANTGTINYATGTLEYDQQTSKAWLIRPMDSSRVVLDFTSFEMLCSADTVKVYDGISFDSPLIGTFQGNQIPPRLVSSGNSMYVEVITAAEDASALGSGFTATYQSEMLEENTYPWRQIDTIGYTIANRRLGVNYDTINTDYALFVRGGIVSDEIVIEALDIPDYVFSSNYSLPALEEIEQFIERNGHLPELPSAAEFYQNGHNLGKTNMLLLKKIEELTLYMIALQKGNSELKKRIYELQAKTQK